jgi:peptidoglycan/LPS O-acetylase OafA/YrhL
MPKKIPQLDGVRGIAILVVMIHNSGQLPRLFANGWMGVDLFFVLSGFLITGILLDTKHSESYFKNFYARRCLRIWPLYYSLLFFMFVLVPYLRPSAAHIVFEKSPPWWAYPLFLQNFFLPVSTNAAGPLAVTWSLAIEEQFYLVWAFVVRFCSAAQVRRVALAVICLSPVVRFYLSSHHVYLYTNVFCRLDGLMAGSLLALLVRSESFLPSRFVKVAWVSLLAAAPLAFVTAALNANWIVFSFTALASVAFVYISLFSQQSWLHLGMTNRFLVYTGTISYGLYLLHKIPFDMVQLFHLDQHPSLVLAVAMLGGYVLAALSWKFLEKPFLSLKRFFEFKPVLVDSASTQVAFAPQTRGAA